MAKIDKGLPVVMVGQGEYRQALFFDESQPGRLTCALPCPSSIVAQKSQEEDSKTIGLTICRRTVANRPSAIEEHFAFMLKPRPWWMPKWVYARLLERLIEMKPTKGIDETAKQTTANEIMESSSETDDSEVT